jgi:hypothetical protein
VHTALRVTLGVAAVVGVGGGGGLMFLVFQGAARCAAGGVHATPFQVLEAAVVGQAAFVALAYLTLFVGFLFGTQAVAKRRGFSRRTPFHLMAAAVLASAAAVLIGTPFLFAG